MRRLAIFFLVTLGVGCGTSNSPTAGKKEPPTNSGNVVQPASTTPVSDKEEALFKGKPTSFWAKQLRGKDVTSRTEAAKALHAIGPAAKSAAAELKLAIKERAWELLVNHVSSKANYTFATVSRSIGSSGAKEPTKDEIIAKLRNELSQKNNEITQLDKQRQDIVDDPCLQALAFALMAIDRRELEAMFESTPAARSSTKTFKNVGTTIGK